MSARLSLKNGVIGIAGILAFAGFIALGNWQLERRHWKLDLIQRVAERVHATPVIAPNVEHWPTINKAHDEYRRVSVNGHFLNDKDTLVVAATELGSGYWVITPFKRADNTVVLVNRGFISQGVQAVPPPTEAQQVVGLLRLSEPKGSVVRDNNPSTGRWYSRDVAAIAASHKLNAAPYFIDAENNSAEQQSPTISAMAIPIAGLTVINFHNSHLVYAITWYGLAMMVIVAGFIIVREARRPN